MSQLASLSLAITQSSQFLNSANHKDTDAFRKKAMIYAEETRTMLLEGVARKEPIKPINRRLIRSSFEISQPFQLKKESAQIKQQKNQHRFEITKPRSFLPAVAKSDHTLASSYTELKSEKATGKGCLTQSFYELDKLHCASVESTLDGHDPDISLSMKTLKQYPSSKQLPELRSSLLLYTSYQKTPAVVVPDLDPFTPSEDQVRNVDYQILAPKFKEFSGNKISFYKDFSRLCEYENVHQKNLISLITRSLDAIHVNNLGSISDDEVLQMVHSLIIHIGDKALVNDEITKALLAEYEKGIASAPDQRELALQLRFCTASLPRKELIPFKAIIGHIRRIAIVYGYHKSVRNLCNLFAELIFSPAHAAGEFLDAAPSELYEIIFKRNGPQTQLSAILELILCQFNTFF
jgi:hypothetical protein